MATQPIRWILVAGTGDTTLPMNVFWCAEALGQRLARGNYGLITGGWKGVDHVVGRAFAEELMGRGDNVLDRLLQVVKEGTFPDYHGGRAAYFREYFDGYAAEIQRADAVVLLGGVGGTYELGSFARQQGLPVFPVAGTGGDATRFYQYLRNIPTRSSTTSPSITELDALNVPITNPSEAETVTELLVGLLATSLSKRADRNKIFISYSREDCVWLNLLKTVLEQYLPEQRLSIWDDTQIEAGDRFEETILQAVETAKVAVLLVSSSFCNSDFIRNRELPELLKAADAGKLRLSWIALDDCRFELASKIQALRAPSQPLSEIKDARQQLSAIHEVCRQIQNGFQASRTR